MPTRIGILTRVYGGTRDRTAMQILPRRVATPLSSHFRSACLVLTYRMLPRNAVHHGYAPIRMSDSVLGYAPKRLLWESGTEVAVGVPGGRSGDARGQHVHQLEP
eukprot:556032-Rhodomonas_salina.1